MRKQQDGESVREYIAHLQRFAKNDNFGNSLNRMQRERIVCGIRDDDARRYLLTRKKLTVQEAEEFAYGIGKSAGGRARHARRAPTDDGDQQQRCAVALRAAILDRAGR
ncbi:hypothetical protein MTO96_047129 [Rhipicephalus appendiculatus]